MREESRYEVILEIIDSYKTAEPKDMRMMLELHVDAVKNEAIKELNNVINTIKRL